MKNKCNTFSDAFYFSFSPVKVLSKTFNMKVSQWTLSIALAKLNVLLRMHLLKIVPNKPAGCSLCITFSLNFSSCVGVLLGPLEIYISWSCHSLFEDFGSVAIVIFPLLYSVLHAGFQVWAVCIFFQACASVCSLRAPKYEWQNLLVKLHFTDPKNQCLPHRVTQCYPSHVADLAQSCCVSVFVRSVKWGRVPVSLPVYMGILGACWLTAP